MNTLRDQHDTAGWQALDRQHFLHPFTDHKALHEHGTRVITRAEGVYLWDSDGNRLLDAMAGLWCVNVGYGRDELAEVGHGGRFPLVSERFVRADFGQNYWGFCIRCAYV